jgi:ketosteroid isomerase-like protein
MGSQSERAEWFADRIRAFFRNDVETFMTLYREDAVYTFPFAVEGMPSRVEGKAAISEWMHRVPEIVTFDGTVTDLVVSEGADTLTAEWSATGRFANGAPASMSYVAVVTLQDGLVKEYHDYMNPLGLQPAFQ